VITATAVPVLSAGLERSRARAAARYLAAQMALARTEAVTRSTTIALRFQRLPGGLTVSVYRDGNGNGVRTREIDSGVDRLLEAPVRLEDLFPGVLIAVPATAATTAVELGGSDLLSFTPAGTATCLEKYVTRKLRFTGSSSSKNPSMSASSSGSARTR